MGEERAERAQIEEDRKEKENVNKEFVSLKQREGKVVKRRETLKKET